MWGGGGGEQICLKMRSEKSDTQRNRGEINREKNVEMGREMKMLCNAVEFGIQCMNIFLGTENILKKSV